jgi:hypothetical protein
MGLKLGDLGLQQGCLEVVHACWQLYARLRLCSQLLLHHFDISWMVCDASFLPSCHRRSLKIILLQSAAGLVGPARMSTHEHKRQCCCCRDQMIHGCHAALLSHTSAISSPHGLMNCCAKLLWCCWCDLHHGTACDCGSACAAHSAQSTFRPSVLCML